MKTKTIRIPADCFSARTHNGMVTIHNPATGNHRTFRIKTIRKGKFAGKRIVSLLVGPEREGRTWRGFAFVNDNGSVYVWSRFQADSVYRTYGMMLQSPMPFIVKGAEYMIEGTCRCCNKPLTHPESIKSGIGPVCAKRQR